MLSLKPFLPERMSLPTFRAFSILVLACALTCPATSAQQPTLPFRISSNGGCLIDQKNQAVFLKGDTQWSLISGLTKDEACLYLDDRQQKNFNALIVNLIEHKHRGPVNREGEAPFSKPGDFATPSERYFAHADWVLRRAADKGIVILLAPMHLGYRQVQSSQLQGKRRDR